MNYIYGPIPSRRLGVSLGISPIPKKTCNYSCIYCQLGRTNHMTNSRKMFYKAEDILSEFKEFLKTGIYFDVVSIVGEGEPTLYLGLGELIKQLKILTDKPVAVITNGALLYDPILRKELSLADLVLPTVNAYDQETFKKINRPFGRLDFLTVHQGLIEFSKEYSGSLWLEIMFCKGYNDSDESIKEYKNLLKNIRYDKLYLNTPVRPPAEAYVEMVSLERMDYIAKELNGLSIALLSDGSFFSDIFDDVEAIKNIIQRHPMNQYEIHSFLTSRNCKNTEEVFEKLNACNLINVINYKGYNTYRLK